MDYSIILFKRQRKNIQPVGNYGRLCHSEILRMSKTCGNYYKKDKCMAFKGHVKNYILEFSYKGNKTSLYRILYHNFIGEIEPSDRIILTCNNFGCCNLDHLIKKK